MALRESDAGALSAERVRACLSESMRGYSIFYWPEIDSTNTQAKQFARQGAGHGSIFLADRQTAGRGRFGKHFYSPAGTGLYMSVLLRPAQTAGFDAQRTTIAAAVAVSEALEEVVGASVSIKWVNDLFLRERKVCGILTEAAGLSEDGRVESVVIGVGVNIATEDFPEELRGIAGSLGASGVDRCRLAAVIAVKLLDTVAHAADMSVLDAYRRRSFLPGREIVFGIGEEWTPAKALRIDDAGRLVVRLRDGREKALASGEVSLRDPSMSPLTPR